KRLLASIVESSSDGIISEDLSGVVTSWNRGAELLFGYTSEEMVGRPISTVIPPDRSDEVASLMDRIRRGEYVAQFDTVRRAKGDKLIDVSTTYSPIRDASGRIVGASKVV